MLRKFNGSSWQDVQFLRRFNGSSWQDSKLKKFDGSNWQYIFPVEKNLYNYGDQCTSITGGWSRIINLWIKYGNYTRSSSRYIDYNADHIYIRTNDWSYNGSVATQNAVDLTYYNNLNILFDFYSYETGTYNNGFDWGVCQGPLTQFMDNYNPSKVKCNGYVYREARAIDIPYTADQTWYNDRVHTINISDLSGLWYIFTAPFSWSWYGDYTIVKIKRIWLSN